MHTYQNRNNSKSAYCPPSYIPSTNLQQSASCEDCVEPIYPTTHITSQCTDQCVVIHCSDPHHDGDNDCHAAEDGPCDLVCDESTNCADCSGFDNFLQCCTDYHSYMSEPRHVDPLSDTTISWDSSFNDFLCSCANMNFNTGSPGLSGQSSAVGNIQPINTPITITPSLPSPLPIAVPVQPSIESPETFTCMWGVCNATFVSLAELVGHVNLNHLRPSTNPKQYSEPLDIHEEATQMTCQWRDCTIYPPESIPTSSTGDQANKVLNFLTNHLLSDHLGISAGCQDLSVTTPPQPELSLGLLSNASTSVESVLSTDQHKCLWRSCGQTFDSDELLTEHISLHHIGSGKAYYQCFWEGCTRHGNNGFSTKQKISRHIQTHTGHRPYQCKVCLQYFSEAATLQQHMRRHTQEKPYVCDFPGCGKTFSITGALTIHKRTHNGQKPFKCKFCDRAFSESSNLSKHLRTHTGARPYSCSEPGCGKSFARPDQLTRHLGVHRKKSPEQTERVALTNTQNVVVI